MTMIDPGLGGVAPPVFDPASQAGKSTPQAWTTEALINGIGAVDQGTKDLFLVWAVNMASGILWRRTGRQFGLTRRSVRPEMRECCCYDYGNTCCDSRRLQLPGRVAAVESVVCDGVVHEASALRILRGRKYVTWANGDHWAHGQDLDRSPYAQWPPVKQSPAVVAAPVDVSGCPAWVRDYIGGTGYNYDDLTPTGVALMASGKGAADWVVNALKNPGLAYPEITHRPQPQWLQDYLISEGLQIVIGKVDCDMCRFDGLTHDPVTGAQYICTHAATGGDPGCCVRVWTNGCGPDCSPRTQLTRECGCTAALVPASSCQPDSYEEIRCPSDGSGIADWAVAYLAGSPDGVTYNINTAPTEQACVTNDNETISGVATQTAPPVFPGSTAPQLPQGSGSLTQPSLTSNGWPAWEVNYWTGKPLPDEAGYIAAMLAYQLLQGVQVTLTGSGNCDPALTPGLKSISSQGLVKTFADPVDLSQMSLTGIKVVDDWVREINPHKLKRKPRIIRADKQNRQTVWSCV